MGDDLVSARVERLGDALDVAALSGGVPALIGRMTGIFQR